jgi:NitT/TauT family transport system substrate-binding protein
MLFERCRIRHVSTAWRIALAAAGWLILISWLHAAFNFDRGERPLLRMGYMPVITNMAAPLLDYASKDGVGLRFEALKFSSFSEMGEALRNGHIQAAFIIAPLSIVLHQQGAGVRIVYIGNRHESTLVFRQALDAKTFADLRGKTIAVPLRYSGHNIAVRRLAEEYGLTGSDLKIVEMNPPDMPSALAIGALDAYFVGEPFGAMTIKSGAAKVLHYVEQVWPGFICNLVLVREDLIKRHSDRVQDLVQGAARAGYWAREHPKEAAQIVSRYWNQPADFVEYVLTTPANRIVYDQFLPKEEEIQFLADQMVKYSLLEKNHISSLVDDRFAKAVNLKGITDIESVLLAPRN